MTLDLSATQRFEVGLDTYWKELCLSLDYQRRLYCEALGCTEMVVLSHQGGYEQGMQRVLRFIKPIDAPAPVRKIFGGHVTIEEHSQWDPREQVWSYRMVPSIMGDRIEIRGRVRAQVAGDGVDQLSHNTVTCRMFGLGAIIEPFVIRSTEEGNQAKAVFTRAYIRELDLH